MGMAAPKASRIICTSVPVRVPRRCDRVVKELIRVGPGAASRLRHGAPSKDLHSLPDLRVQVMEERRGVPDPNRRGGDTQTGLLLGPTAGLFDSLSSCRLNIDGEVGSQPGCKVDLLRGEEGQGDRVFPKAENRGHLPRRRRADQSDVRKSLSHAAEDRLVIGVERAEEKACLRLHSIQRLFALSDDGFCRGLGINVIAVADRHPKHGLRIRPAQKSRRPSKCAVASGRVG
jgi:hypothetical protein